MCNACAMMAKTDDLPEAFVVWVAYGYLNLGEDYPLAFCPRHRALFEKLIVAMNERLEATRRLPESVRPNVHVPTGNDN